MAGLQILEIQEERRAEIDKILQSQVLRTSESLRRLLAFLSDKTLAGEADQLKEYSIGIDAFGKPPDYDPRHDSAVRIQVGRLRQKLSEYYRTEGKDDPLIVELPKGGFRLQFETRPKPPRIEFAPAPQAPAPVRHAWSTRTLAAALVLAVIWAICASIGWVREARYAATARSAWTPELEALWAPFIQSDRTTIIAVSAPLFIGFRGFAFYRDPTLNKWDDVPQDPKIKSVMRAFGNPEVFPHRSYTGIGDANAVLLLGKLLGSRRGNLVFSRTADLSWQQMSSNNVVLLGTPRSFGELLSGTPAQLEIGVDARGFRVLRPRAGEPEFLAGLDGQTAVTVREDGEVYALITQIPGPNGNGVMASFSSNLNAGTLAAVQWFSEPRLASNLVRLLRDSAGSIPRYYQVVLRVRFKGGVPTETTYVLHRVLRTGTAPGQH